MARILIVEDHELNRDMLSRCLMRAGYDVGTAEDGRKALEMVAAAAPDLIVMDISLPELDGLDATRMLKNDEATRAIPIIILTAHALETDRQRANDAGADAFATKPVDLPSFLQQIHGLLEP